VQTAACVKFHENLSGGIRAFPSVTTDRHEVNSRFSNAPEAGQGLRSADLQFRC
jgi:hypothetical protein